MLRRFRSSRPRHRGVSVALGLVALAVLSGCQLVGLVGVMARTFEETGSSVIAEEYDGLRGNSFAVIVSADRFIMGTSPRLQTNVCYKCTQILANTETTGASGFVPPQLVLEFQLTTPTWNSWTYDQLREEFGVDRLIVVDISEFRLNEPGNRYIWDGVAVARVGVVEKGSALPDDFAFSKDIRVAYPDNQGYTPSDLPASHVNGMLEKRLVDRITWLFFEHEEANAIEY
ncbi:MAG: hypothetical protein RLN60_02480 [Phycisphaerales bacterium]